MTSFDRPFDILDKASSNNLVTKLHLPNENVSEIKPTDAVVQKSALVTLTQPQSAAMQADADRKIIAEALGGIEQSNVDSFQAKYALSMQSIMDATAQELAEIRKSGQDKVGFGGLKKAGIKQWKFVVKLDEDGKITELFIGKFKAKGTFTKVYLTLDDKAILVPKKDRSSSESQMLKAYDNIYYLHSKYQGNTKEMQEIQQVLPPKPEKIMVGSRPILVTSQATCAADKFHFPPKDIGEIIERLEVLKDAVAGIDLAHKTGLIHGDLKLDNILISRSGRGQPHDLGGSSIFYDTDAPLEAGRKYTSMSRTPFYTHYQDELYRQAFVDMDAPVERFLQLGRKTDVFALGVAIVEALIGKHDANGKRQYPFEIDAYIQKDGRQYPFDATNARSEITCVKDISPDIDDDLQTLLDEALHPEYFYRTEVDRFVRGLVEIITDLKDKNIVKQPLALDSESYPEGHVEYI